MRELSRLTVTISRETEEAMRSFLADRGGNWRLSKFIERAVNNELLRATVREIQDQNSQLPADAGAGHDRCGLRRSALRVPGRSKGGGLSDPRPLRVILDTNILLSALIRRDSIPASLMRAWHQNRYALLTHSLQLQELRAVTRRTHIRRLAFVPLRLGASSISFGRQRSSWTGCQRFGGQTIRPTTSFWRFAKKGPRIIWLPVIGVDY